MSKVRVLIVDDAIFMRDMIKDTFTGDRFEIAGEATNGVEAVERYKQLKPDLVTMDIVMPFKSGIEATKDIRAFDKTATIIMFSAPGQESLVMEAIEAGAADFVVKLSFAITVMGGDPPSRDESGLSFEHAEAEQRRTRVVPQSPTIT
jgi:two-component system chemotaxis response regulator CheY